MAAAVDNLAEEIAAFAERNSETARIRNLPRKDPDRVVPDYTPDNVAPGMRLKDTQNEALHEIKTMKGLDGLIGVGHGKTLICLLTCWILDIPPQDALILLKPRLIPTFHREANKWWRAGYPVKIPHVMSYSALSQGSNADYFDRMRPSVIILDEAHMLRHRSSARAKRFYRCLKRDKPILVWMTGTGIRTSIKDIATLSEHSLHEGSPIPRPSAEWQTVSAWKRVIDLDNLRDDFGYVNPQDEYQVLRACGGATLDAVFDRIQSTPGVVATTSTSCQASLEFLTYSPSTPMPEEMKTALEETDRTWTLPGGEEITDALGKWRALQQLACGYYYVWDWPDGVIDREWLAKRADWHRELRDYLKAAVPGRDAPSLVRFAITGGKWKVPPHLKYAWDQWCTVKDRPKPPTKTVWMEGCTKWAVEQALADAPKAQDKGGCRLVWYTSPVVAKWVKDNMCPKENLVCMSKDDPPPVPRPGVKQMWVSTVGHREGLNLQDHYREQVVLYPPSAGDVWQQFLARTHREGQPHDTVYTHIALTTGWARDALSRAREHSDWLGELTGEPQKLGLGTWV